MARRKAASSTKVTLPEWGSPRRGRLNDLPGQANGYKDVAVVDDVVTTGATGNELARLLKRGGAGRVRLWSLPQAAASGNE